MKAALVILTLCVVAFVIGIKKERYRGLAIWSYFIAWIGVWFTLTADGLPIPASLFYCTMMSILMFMLYKSGMRVMPIFWFVMVIVGGIWNICSIDRPDMDGECFYKGATLLTDSHRYCSKIDEDKTVFAIPTKSGAVRRHSRCEYCGRRWNQHYGKQISREEQKRIWEAQSEIFSMPGVY